MAAVATAGRGTTCQKLGAAGGKAKILRFHSEDRTCTACHEDVHHGEFNERMARRRADGTPQGCEACHNVKSWADVNGFDHSKTKFPLQIGRASCRERV